MEVLGVGAASQAQPCEISTKRLAAVRATGAGLAAYILGVPQHFRFVVKDDLQDGVGGLGVETVLLQFEPETTHDLCVSGTGVFSVTYCMQVCDVMAVRITIQVGSAVAEFTDKRQLAVGGEVCHGISLQSGIFTDMDISADDQVMVLMRHVWETTTRTMTRLLVHYDLNCIVHYYLH